MAYAFNPFTGKLDETNKNIVDTQIGISTVIVGLQTGTFSLPGPYANEADAITAGVPSGAAYYRTGGQVFIVEP